MMVVVSAPAVVRAAGRGDQADAAFGAAEAAGIVVCVLPHHEAGGDADTFFDDDVAQTSAAADVGVGEDDRLLDAGVGMDVDAGEQQRLAQERAGDDAAAGNQRGDRLAAAADFLVDEFGGGRDLGVGPDRPVAIVEIQRRDDGGEVDVGFPVRVERADVAPVGLAFGAGGDAGVGEAVSDGFAVLD
jgi:hypothetical protein